MMTNPVKKGGKKVITDGIMDYLAKGRLQEWGKERAGARENPSQHREQFRGTQLPK